MENEKDFNTEHYFKQSEYKQRVSHFLDNWIMTASLGSFGLSFAFIKSMASPIRALWLIETAWVAFVLSTVTIIATCVLVIDHYDQSQEKMMDDPSYNRKKDPRMKRQSRFILYMNKFGLSVFVVGIICALVFAILNLNMQLWISS